MKKIFYFIALFAFTITSCDKNEVSGSKMREHNDYSSTVSQNRVLIAQSLIESFNENSLLASKIITECNKKFDGDKNVLCKNLFDMPVDNRENIKFSTILNRSTQIQKVKSTSNNNNFASSIISQDSLVQIYYYTSSSDSISNSYEGIVVIPENVRERDGKDLLVIKKDGTTTYIRSDVDPDKNYLVISRNERTNFAYLPSQVSSLKKLKSATTADGKPMKIVQAIFTSIDGKRTVESWWGGEPEVRLNVIYGLINPVTNAVTEVRNSSFMYPGQWLVWGWKNSVKWNTTPIDCPFFNSNEKNYGRRLMWTEEDGSTRASTISTGLTDKNTGLTTSFSTTIPATDNDVIFADSWIDYDDVGTGKTYTWGVMKFQVSCQ